MFSIKKQTKSIKRLFRQNNPIISNDLFAITRRQIFICFRVLVNVFVFHLDISSYFSISQSNVIYLTVNRILLSTRRTRSRSKIRL